MEDASGGLCRGLDRNPQIAAYPWAEGVELVTKNSGAPIKPGNTIRLRSGYHGEIEFFGGYNAETITIEAEPGHSPEFKRLRLVAVSNWVLRGLVVSPSAAPEYSRSTLIKIENHRWHGPSHDVVVEQCRLYSVADSSSWSIDDWNSEACSGMFEDWVIENNVVMINHWHGISLYGAKNCRVFNNTVVDLDTASPGPPWIRIAEHKNGAQATGCIVRNNLSTAYIIGSDPSMVADHNLTVSNPENYFRNHQAHDLRLKAGCAAIDAASADQAPPTDIGGASRPLGSAVDAGAHEYPIEDDMDGMADWWERQFFLTTTDPQNAASEDWDGDDTDNLTEFEAGTDPKDRHSAFRMIEPMMQDDRITLQWPSRYGKTYAIEKSESLSDGFQPEASGISGVPPINTHEIDPSASGSMFFRLIIEP